MAHVAPSSLALLPISGVALAPAAISLLRPQVRSRRARYVEHTIEELKALTPDVVIPMHCTGRAFIAKMRTEMPEQLVDWNTGSRFTFGV
jgi:hypothetical protein